VAMEFEHKLPVAEMNPEECLQFAAPIVAGVSAQIRLRLCGCINPLEILFPVICELQGCPRFHVLKNEPPLSQGKAAVTVSGQRRRRVVVLTDLEMVLDAGNLSKTPIELIFADISIQFGRRQFDGRALCLG